MLWLSDSQTNSTVVPGRTSNGASVPGSYTSAPPGPTATVTVSPAVSWAATGVAMAAAAGSVAARRKFRLSMAALRKDAA
jgi:hypothetical protein